MKKLTVSKGQNLFTVIATLPFLIAVLFLLINLFFSNNISLEAPFNFNLIAVLFFFIVQLGIILILMKFDKIEFSFPNSLVMKILSIFALLFLFVISNFLLVMALKMNFNFWLKCNKVEILELIVVDKKVSHGKATDYYIILDSREGRFHNKVSPSKYDSFKLGESFQAKVNKGFFDGYYLTKQLK